MSPSQALGAKATTVTATVQPLPQQTSMLIGKKENTRTNIYHSRGDF